MCGARRNQPLHERMAYLARSGPCDLIRARISNTFDPGRLESGRGRRVASKSHSDGRGKEFLITSRLFEASRLMPRRRPRAEEIHRSPVQVPSALQMSLIRCFVDESSMHSAEYEPESRTRRGRTNDLDSARRGALHLESNASTSSTGCVSERSEPTCQDRPVVLGLKSRPSSGAHLPLGMARSAGRFAERSGAEPEDAFGGSEDQVAARGGGLLQYECLFVDSVDQSKNLPRGSFGIHDGEFAAA